MGAIYVLNRKSKVLKRKHFHEIPIDAIQHSCFKNLLASELPEHSLHVLRLYGSF